MDYFRLIFSGGQAMSELLILIALFICLLLSTIIGIRSGKSYQDIIDDEEKENNRFWRKLLGGNK